MKLNFQGTGPGGVMSLPRDISMLDNLNINAEHLVKRTTVGGTHKIIMGLLRRWVKYLSEAMLAWMMAILFLMNDIPILGLVCAVLGAYYYGHYKIWRQRWTGRLSFPAMVPLL